MAGFKPPSAGAKPKTGTATAKASPRSSFVLGSRPDTMRSPSPAPVNRIKPAGAGTRDYGKPGAGVPMPAGQLGGDNGGF